MRRSKQSPWVMLEGSSENWDGSLLLIFWSYPQWHVHTLTHIFTKSIMTIRKREITQKGTPAGEKAETHMHHQHKALTG